jgi:hypothetical protein
LKDREFKTHGHRLCKNIFIRSFKKFPKLGIKDLLQNQGDEKMKRGGRVLLLLLGVVFLSLRPVYAQQEQKPAQPQQAPSQQEQKPAEPAEKPLGPGWLSLDCCIGPLDNALANGKSSIERTLGINISGFLDAGYNWASSHPKKNRALGLGADISGRYFDKDYNRVEFNDFNITIDKPEKDWGVGFHLSGDFGRTAELLREATFWGRTLHKEPSAELREAFLTTTIPVGEGISVKGGLFVTPLGMEIIPAPGAYNDNISRSFLFNLGVPLRHLGTLFSYPIYKKDKDTTVATASAGVITGWDDPRDNNHTPSFLGGVTVTPSDTFTFTSNFTIGEEPVAAAPPSARNTARFAISNVWTIKPIDPLGLSLEYTWGHQGKASLGGTRAATWQGVAGIASYSWTDRFTTALRGEFFNDRDGFRTGGSANHAKVNLAEGTLTAAYKFTKMLLGRAEVRHDVSDEAVYRVGSTNFDRHQTTLALQLIYTY